MKKKQQESRPVIVTTAHRGVFFGYAVATTGETIDLAKARMCVYWSVAMKGVMGLASIGPDSACRIGPAIQSISIRNVTAVLEVSPEAAARWESAPWQ